MFVGWQKIINTKASRKSINTHCPTKVKFQKRICTNQQYFPFHLLSNSSAMTANSPEDSHNKNMNDFLLPILKFHHFFLCSYTFNCCHHPSYSMLIHLYTKYSISNASPQKRKVFLLSFLQQFFLFKEIFMSCYHAHISSANIACLTTKIRM